SATVPTDIQNLIARYTTNAETLLLSGDVFTVEHIHHIRYDVSDALPITTLPGTRVRRPRGASPAPTTTGIPYDLATISLKVSDSSGLFSSVVYGESFPCIAGLL
ncbi:hypothetical protein, partial [Archangium sp.]|uniref:hypothetical protein n=1 Tax=Archangium sp. TaxID=1872627 RepID=UPI002D560E07